MKQLITDGIKSGESRFSRARTMEQHTPLPGYDTAVTIKDPEILWL
jgi:hypothetical protein